MININSEENIGYINLAKEILRIDISHYFLSRKELIEVSLNNSANATILPTKLIQYLNAGKTISEISLMSGCPEKALELSISKYLMHKEDTGENITEVLKQWNISEEAYVQFKNYLSGFQQ